MLGKLLKYEFRSIGRLLVFIYAAVIVCAVILGGVVRSSLDVVMKEEYVDMYSNLDYIAGIFGVIYGILLAAMVIITLVMIIMRFYRNMLGSEGYLMHTLPVQKWELVTSKLITALVWMIIGIAVGLFSVLIILGISGTHGFWDGLWDTDTYKQAFSAGEIIFVIFLSLVTMTAMILRFYFSMAIGNLANKYKFAVSVGAFIGITIIISVLQRTVVSVDLLEMILFGVNSALSPGIINPSNIRELVFQIILAAGFFAGTTWILQKRLNLE